MTKKPQASSVSPEYVLLGMIHQQPAHGYDLHERITQQLGQIWNISLSQTYNILNRLEERGLITGALEEQEKAPARRRFCSTISGRRHFEAWLHKSTEPSSHAIRVEFLTRLYFVHATEPENIGQLIDTQIDDTRAALSRMQTALAELPPDQVFNRLGLELRVHQLNSILIWLENCRVQLGGAPPKPTDQT